MTENLTRKELVNQTREIAGCMNWHIKEVVDAGLFDDHAIIELATILRPYKAVVSPVLKKKTLPSKGHCLDALEVAKSIETIIIGWVGRLQEGARI